MGGKNAPAAPNYQPIAQASQYQSQLADQEFQSNLAQQQLEYNTSIDQANKQYGLQQQALNWGEQQYNTTAQQNQQVIDAQIKAQQATQDAAAQAQQRYQTVYQPLEDQAVQQAETYASPDNKALLMGQAAGQVASNVAGQRQAALQNLEGYGIDPSSTRYSAMDIGMRTAGAAAAAGAGTQAGLNADATQRALQANAINVGRGLSSDVNAGYNTSVGAGNAAVNAGNATLATGANIYGTGAQWAGLANQTTGIANQGAASMGGLANEALNAGTGALGTWGNTLNMGYNNQLAQFNANQNASSGFGSLLGTAVGAASMFAATGGPVPGAGAIPVGASTGGVVPMHASPSGGRVPDDVPAQLTPGEFVIPNDVMRWKGQEFFQKAIADSRQKMQSPATAPAQPRTAAIPVGQPPAFVSRPMPQQAPAAALPVR